MNVGNIAISGADLKTATIGADKAVIKASAGKLFGLNIYSLTGFYILVFDRATAPVDTNVPVLVFKVGADSHLYVDFGHGVPFAAGIAVAASTTAGVLTLPSPANNGNAFLAVYK